MATNLRECIECGGPFDPHSSEKRRSGGRINQCPDCSVETSVRYLGLSSGDGKQASVTILSFGSNSDRDRYASFYRNNSGVHRGKACQLGAHLSTDPGVKFRTVVREESRNHKGRL